MLKFELLMALERNIEFREAPEPARKWIGSMRLALPAPFLV
jgi:hypothetical protein